MRAFTYVYTHFRPRDKDGGHTIRSAIAEIHATRKLHGCFIEPELLTSKVCAGIGIVGLFAPMTLTLTRWPSYTNSTRIPWRYTGYANMNCLRQGFRKLSPDRHT